jgi:hypothetical protein
MAGGVYFLATAQAQAGVATNGQLMVVTNKVAVVRGGNAVDGSTGYLLQGGDTVKTDATGRASVQFPDGSQTRLAPSTEIVVDKAELSKKGDLKTVSLGQKAGRTLTTVRKLVQGSSYSVQGHAASASVRGTTFEEFTRPDGSMLVQDFDGSVRVAGKTTVTLATNQQVEVKADGTLGPVQALVQDPNDPFNLWRQAEQAGQPPGGGAAVQVFGSGGAVPPGGTGTHSYVHGGGDLYGSVGFPGSRIRVKVTGPRGDVINKAETRPPLTFALLNAEPGIYTATVTYEDGSGQYILVISTRLVCETAQDLDANGIVRKVMSQDQLKSGIEQAGGTKVSAKIVGSSPNSARISGGLTYAGTAVEGTVVFYPSPPNLMVKIAAAKVSGIDVTSDAANYLARATGRDFNGFDVGFDVTNVSSCNGFAVVEGKSRLTAPPP